MRIHSPSLAELHAFAATARHGSFSKAADELCVTQGAISRAVARLEEHLGQRLLQRRGRHSELTAVGRRYLETVAPALQSLESAAVALAADARGGLRLRLSAPPTLFAKWLIPRLPDFRVRHPEVALSFAPYRRDDRLDAPDIDAWIRVAGETPLPSSMHSEYIVGREIVPICRPQDLVGRGALRRPQDLLRRPLLFHTHYPDNWRLWFRSQGVETGHMTAAADFDQVALLVQAVIAGLGLAVVQRCLVEEELATQRIAIPVDRPVATPRGYHLCHPAQRDGRALRAFREWLLAQAGLAEGGRRVRGLLASREQGDKADR